jgi:hypothetical protein
LSNESVTLAIPLGVRPAEPAKMTSIISFPRRLLLERSPSTHLIASTMLLLPHPFGPTTPITSSSKVNSVASANDLNPLSVSLRRRIGSATSLSPGLPGFPSRERRSPPQRGTYRRPNPWPRRSE